MEQGAAAGVDLLIGTNRDELTLFSLGRPELMALDDAKALSWVVNAAPDVPAQELLSGYREARTVRTEGIDPHALTVAIGTDAVFRWPSLQLAAAQQAQGARTFVYLFEWESPAFGGFLARAMPWNSPLSSGWCMCPRYSSSPEAVSRSRRCRPRCSRHGSPLPATVTRRTPALEGGWPAWDPRKRTTMVFGRQTGATDGPRNAELAVWERYRPLFSPPVP